MSDQLTTLRSNRDSIAKKLEASLLPNKVQAETLEFIDSLIASMEAQEPVAEIFWTNENPEWQLNMLVEPSCPSNERIKVYTGDYKAAPMLYIGTTAAQPSEPIKEAQPMQYTDEQLTEIYNQANNIAKGKAPPITTQKIFTAMRAIAQPKVDYQRGFSDGIAFARQPLQCLHDPATLQTEVDAKAEPEWKKPPEYVPPLVKWAQEQKPASWKPVAVYTADLDKINREAKQQAEAFLSIAGVTPTAQPKTLTPDLQEAIESMIHSYEQNDLDGWEVQLVKRRLKEAL